MSEEEGKQLVRDAIRAGIFNDMGSGSNVDLAVIKAKDDVSFVIIGDTCAEHDAWLTNFINYGAGPVPQGI